LSEINFWWIQKRKCPVDFLKIVENGALVSKIGIESQ
jgi:hypothetical protein